MGISSLLTWGTELDIYMSLLLLALRLSWVDIGKGRSRHLHLGLNFVGLTPFVNFFYNSQSCLALNHQLGFCLG